MGLKFIKGEWQAHLDKYLKLTLLEMVGWNPGLRKKTKEFQQLNNPIGLFYP